MHKDVVIPFNDILRANQPALNILAELHTTEHTLAHVIVDAIMEAARCEGVPTLTRHTHDDFLAEFLQYCFEQSIFRGAFEERMREPLYTLVLQMYNRLNQFVQLACEPAPHEFVSGWGIKDWVGGSPAIFIEYSSYGSSYPSAFAA